MSESAHTVSKGVGVDGEDDAEFDSESQSEAEEDITLALWEEEHSIPWMQGFILMSVVLALCRLRTLGLLCTYLLYIPLLIRSKVIEISISLALESFMWAYLSVRLYAFERFDWYTDGAYPVQAWSCDARLTPGFAASFRES